MAAVNETRQIINNDPFSSAQDIQQQHNSGNQSTDQLRSSRDEGEETARNSWSEEHSHQQQELNRKNDDDDDNNNNNSNQQGSGNAGNSNTNNEQNQRISEQNQAAQQSWYQRTVEKYGALELDNKGSVARDHLALERTFLAWLRTSLSFASIGIAVTQLFRLNSTITCDDKTSTSSEISSNHLLSPPSSSSSSLLEILLAPPSSNKSNGNSTTRFRNIGKPLGATFIGIAILILVIGFHRYFEAQYWIVRGKFPASRGSVALVSFVAGGLVIASFVVILAVAPNAMEL